MAGSETDAGGKESAVDSSSIGHGMWCWGRLQNEIRAEIEKVQKEIERTQTQQVCAAVHTLPSLPFVPVCRCSLLRIPYHPSSLPRLLPSQMAAKILVMDDDAVLNEVERTEREINQLLGLAPPDPAPAKASAKKGKASVKKAAAPAAAAPASDTGLAAMIGAMVKEEQGFKKAVNQMSDEETIRREIMALESELSAHGIAVAPAPHAPAYRSRAPPRSAVRTAASDRSRRVRKPKGKGKRRRPAGAGGGGSEEDEDEDEDDEEEEEGGTEEERKQRKAKKASKKAAASGGAAEDNILYCLCRKRHDATQPMIGCDFCDEW